VSAEKFPGREGGQQKKNRKKVPKIALKILSHFEGRPTEKRPKNKKKKTGKQHY